MLYSPRQNMLRLSMITSLLSMKLNTSSVHAYSAEKSRSKKAALATSIHQPPAKKYMKRKIFAPLIFRRHLLHVNQTFLFRSNKRVAAFFFDRILRLVIENDVLQKKGNCSRKKRLSIFCCLYSDKVLITTSASNVFMF